MRHHFHLEGFNLKLRPVREGDAPFIVWLRNLDFVKGKVGDSAADVASQETWLKSYFERAGDYYFIVETLTGIPLGTHGIYDIVGTSAEKGRHIIRSEVMAGLPNEILMMDFAFQELGLSELRSNHVSTNVNLYSLHRKCGFKQVGVKRGAQMVGGSPVDLVQYTLTMEDWSAVRDRLLPLAQLAGQHLLEWSKTQTTGRQPWEGS